jgi:hypothetical protein
VNKIYFLLFLIVFCFNYSKLVHSMEESKSPIPRTFSGDSTPMNVLLDALIGGLCEMHRKNANELWTVPKKHPKKITSTLRASISPHQKIKLEMNIVIYEGQSSIIRPLIESLVQAEGENDISLRKKSYEELKNTLLIMIVIQELLKNAPTEPNNPKQEVKKYGYTFDNDNLHTGKIRIFTVETFLDRLKKASDEGYTVEWHPKFLNLNNIIITKSMRALKSEDLDLTHLNINAAGHIEYVAVKDIYNPDEFVSKLNNIKNIELENSSFSLSLAFPSYQNYGTTRFETEGDFYSSTGTIEWNGIEIKIDSNMWYNITETEAQIITNDRRLIGWKDLNNKIEEEKF